MLEVELMAMQEGLLRELNPGPLAPEAKIIPVDQAANETKAFIPKGHANVRTWAPLNNGAAKCVAIEMPQASNRCKVL